MNSSTIMIIDDEPQMRKLIRMLLEKEGYTVIEATDGVHALSLIRQNSSTIIDCRCDDALYGWLYIR